jgi:hypothetical protein
VIRQKADRIEAPEQLDIETAIEEAEQGFDGWDVFAPPAAEDEDEAA